MIELIISFIALSWFIGASINYFCASMVSVLVTLRVREEVPSFLEVIKILFLSLQSITENFKTILKSWNTVPASLEVLWYELIYCYLSDEVIKGMNDT